MNSAINKHTLPDQSSSTYVHNFKHIEYFDIHTYCTHTYTVLLKPIIPIVIPDDFLHADKSNQGQHAHKNNTNYINSYSLRIY